MFTVINGVLLKPLPYAQPDRLLALQERTDWSTQWGNLWNFSYPNYRDCKREVRSVELAAWRWGGGTISQPGNRSTWKAQISSGLFPVFGVPLVQGRVFCRRKTGRERLR